MYAVVEFEGRKCAVVPLNWLTEEQQKCYWPKSSAGSTFEKRVISLKEPASTWQKDVIPSKTD